MRCKDQLDPDEEDETRQIVSVRIAFPLFSESLPRFPSFYRTHNYA